MTSSFAFVVGRVRWPRMRAWTLVAGCSAVLLSNGCSLGGGGGGGSGGDVTQPPQAFETEEYRASYGLGAIAASSAYGAGATGRGVRVAVIDTGIDLDHPEFAGAIAGASVDIVTGQFETIDDPDGHGTAVAGLVGARKNDALSHGVAFDARLLVVRADELGSCATGCAFASDDVAAATDYALDHGAGVINYSLGGATGLPPVLEAALTRAAEGDALLVFAAGNQGEVDPTFPAQFAGSDAAAGTAIAVGAVDADNRIAGFSNRAGVTAEHFLVAPGVALLAPAAGGGSALVSGTSFAAPHVSGAAALLLQAAPHLNAAEIASLLLDTATDLGAPGTDPVYGRGLLDLGAALSPQGTLGVPLDDQVDGRAAPLESSRLSMSQAFGSGPELGRALMLDGYGRGYWVDLDARVAGRRPRRDLLGWLAPERASREVSASPVEGIGLTLGLRERDPAEPAPWDRDEGNDVEGFVLDATIGETTRLSLMQGVGLQGRFGAAAMAADATGGLLGLSAFGSPYLALAEGGHGLALAQELDGGWSVRVGFSESEGGVPGPFAGGSDTAMLAELGHDFAGGSRIGLLLGQLDEQSALLDASGDGALALADGARTRFVGLAGALALTPGLELFGQAGIGLTAPGGSAGGLIDDVSTLRSHSAGAGLAKRYLLSTNDRLVLAVSQPLRVEAGDASIDRPIARTLDGHVSRRDERIDLEPSGRQLNLEMAYDIDLAVGRRLGVNWLTELQPGHDSDAKPTHAIALRFQHRF
jgi:hypothetical protein